MRLFLFLSVATLAVIGSIGKAETVHLPGVCSQPYYAAVASQARFDTHYFDVTGWFLVNPGQDFVVNVPDNFDYFVRANAVDDVFHPLYVERGAGYVVHLTQKFHVTGINAFIGCRAEYGDNQHGGYAFNRIGNSPPPECADLGDGFLMLFNFSSTKPSSLGGWIASENLSCP